MKKQTNLKVLAAGFSMMALIGTSMIVHAEELGGAAEAAQDTEYELEEMLQYAIEDEYLAFTEYNLMLKKFGEQRPFSNIVNAEEYHISLLEPLFEVYDLSIPEQNWEEMITIPDSLEDAYQAGILAEEANIAMYEQFLQEEIPEDVKVVFENLLSASNRHLNALMRQENNSCLEDGNSGQGMGKNGTGIMGNGSGSGMGMGKGSENGSSDGSGNCTFE